MNGYPLKFKVDGNGRLVPATDDEVIAVEDLLEDDKCKVRSIDAGQTLGCSINSGSKPCDSKTAEFEGSGPVPKFFFIYLSIFPSFVSVL